MYIRIGPYSILNTPYCRCNAVLSVNVLRTRVFVTPAVRLSALFVPTGPDPIHIVLVWEPWLPASRAPPPPDFRLGRLARRRTINGERRRDTSASPRVSRGVWDGITLIDAPVEYPLHASQTGPASLRACSPFDLPVQEGAKQRVSSAPCCVPERHWRRLHGE